MSGVPIAERWFRSERLADGVYLIWEHHLSPDVHCNIWFVEGRDRNLMFDSGMGLRSLKEELAFLSEKPVVCVAGHSHFDHMGGHWEFEDRVGHAAEADIMAAPTAANTLAADYIEPHHFVSLPYEGFTCQNYTLRSAPLTRLVDEGDVIDLGDRHFTVLHVPGHSPVPSRYGRRRRACCSPTTASMMASFYDGQLLDELFHSNIPDHLESMAHIKEIPVRTVRPGHYDSFGRDRLKDIADDYIAGRRKPGCSNES